MNLFYFGVVAYITGIPAAWAFGKYLLAVEKRKPLSAAVWDIVILVLSTLITLSLWSISGDSPFVFLGYILGNATGTYMIVTQAKKDDDEKIN